MMIRRTRGTLRRMRIEREVEVSRNSKPIGHRSTASRSAVRVLLEQKFREMRPSMSQDFE
jgi:hypothetical protein